MAERMNNLVNAALSLIAHNENLGFGTAELPRQIANDKDAVELLAKLGYKVWFFDACHWITKK